MRILVVEDEHKIARLIKEALVQEAFAVDLCFDGDEGLQTALTQPYDVIILDWMLPGSTDGLAICASLREAGNHTPIILLTARDQIRDRVSGLRAGADDYIVKPFSLEELIARIQALLRRPHDTIGDLLTAADLRMNTVTKEVQRAGQHIKLSSKEYALLEYLLRNKNKVLSKNMIINHVWNFDTDILPSTVEVFIVYLRAKIDKPFSGPPIIETVRGFGYKVSDAS